jgi:hypothetical protein
VGTTALTKLKMQAEAMDVRRKARRADWTEGSMVCEGWVTRTGPVVFALRSVCRHRQDVASKCSRE